MIRHSEVEGMFKVTFTLPLNPGPGETVTTQTMCVTQVTNINPIHNKQQMPQLLECDKTAPFQKWRWTYKFDFNYNWEKPKHGNQES